MILVEFPDPFTVTLPVPVISPSTLNSPAPPERKSTVTALLLIHPAKATVIAPILSVVLPSTTDETVG